MQSPNVHLIAVAAIAVAYGFTVIILGVLVLVLHDGEATTSVVASLTQLGWAGLGALVFILTGRSLINVIGSSAANATAPQATTQVVNQIATSEEKKQ